METPVLVEAPTPTVARVNALAKELNLRFLPPAAPDGSGKMQDFTVEPGAGNRDSSVFDTLLGKIDTIITAEGTIGQNAELKKATEDAFLRAQLILTYGPLNSFRPEGFPLSQQLQNGMIPDADRTYRAMAILLSGPASEMHKGNLLEEKNWVLEPDRIDKLPLPSAVRSGVSKQATVLHFHNVPNTIGLTASMSTVDMLRKVVRATP